MRPEDSPFDVLPLDILRVRDCGVDRWPPLQIDTPLVVRRGLRRLSVHIEVHERLPWEYDAVGSTKRAVAKYEQAAFEITGITP